MSKTLYLFRHGLATLSQQGYGEHVLTAELLPQGLPAVKNLAAYLKDVPAELHLASPLTRCQQTVAVVSEVTGKQFQVDDRLREFHQESFGQLLERVTHLHQELLAHPADNLMICTHGIIIAALTHLHLEKDFSPAQEFDYPPPAGLYIVSEGKVESCVF